MSVRGNSTGKAWQAGVRRTPRRLDLGELRQFSFHCGEVFIDHVIQQAVLCATRFTALAKAVALEEGQLVGQLLIADFVVLQGLVALAELGGMLRLLLIQLRDQLRCHLAELILGEE
jgi:hypothetical protein